MKQLRSEIPKAIWFELDEVQLMMNWIMSLEGMFCGTLARRNLFSKEVLW